MIGQARETTGRSCTVWLSRAIPGAVSENVPRVSQIAQYQVRQSGVLRARLVALCECNQAAQPEAFGLARSLLSFFELFMIINFRQNALCWSHQGRPDSDDLSTPGQSARSNGGGAREVSLVASGSDGIRIRQALSLGEIVDDMVPRMGWMAIQRRAASQRKCVATEYFEQDKEYKWSPLYPTRSNRP